MTDARDRAELRSLRARLVTCNQTLESLLASNAILVERLSTVPAKPPPPPQYTPTWPFFKL